MNNYCTKVGIGYIYSQKAWNEKTMKEEVEHGLIFSKIIENMFMELLHIWSQYTYEIKYLLSHGELEWKLSPSFHRHD
ncbi:hypothetical protein BpHYR1_042123 [Brachionus plicatilis]|uniref:Uncharacterized protein n=1 Tax=Brachionus plicatilis TaxID=10195 RepID=A0A3M7R2Y6_BRAPC|nr:hypothetical protein BpHYR1_042123 [Brachionus plicatilis]